MSKQSAQTQGGSRPKEDWVASQYLDDGRWGVLSSANEIIVGIREGLTEQQVRLIAAAPDLLAELKCLVDRYEYDGVPHDTAPFIEAARYAIARATGEQQ